MTKTNTPTAADIVDALAGYGYAPTDSEHPNDRTDNVIAYFARKRWDAVRDNGDSLTFARWTDDELEIMATNLNGVIDTQARFSHDRQGIRMFLTCAELRP